MDDNRESTITPKELEKIVGRIEPEPKPLTPLEALVASIATFSKLTEFAVEGIRDNPARVIRNVGLYQQEKSTVLGGNGLPVPGPVHLVGIQVPIPMAVAIVEAFNATGKTPLMEGLKAKLGPDLGVDIRIHTKPLPPGPNIPEPS